MPSVGFSLTIHNGKGKPMTTALTTDLGQLTETLDSLLAAISRVPSVYDARRIMPGEGANQMKQRV